MCTLYCQIYCKSRQLIRIWTLNLLHIFVMLCFRSLISLVSGTPRLSAVSIAIISLYYLLTNICHEVNFLFVSIGLDAYCQWIWKSQSLIESGHNKRPSMILYCMKHDKDRCGVEMHDKLTKDTPCLVLWSELWNVFFGYCWENWPSYDVTALFKVIVANKALNSLRPSDAYMRR